MAVTHKIKISISQICYAKKVHRETKLYLHMFHNKITKARQVIKGCKNENIEIAYNY